jgi:hypothetical protein
MTGNVIPGGIRRAGRNIPHKPVYHAVHEPGSFDLSLSRSNAGGIIDETIFAPRTRDRTGGIIRTAGVKEEQ